MQTNYRIIFSIIISGLIAWGCNSKKKEIIEKVSLGRVDPQLEEASGLVASMANPGLFWVVNDSGNPPEIFLIDQQAKTRLVCTLFNGSNRDWEDIAIGAGPKPEKKYVYVADIGDNWSQNELKYIYRFEEPVLSSQSLLNITVYDTLILRIPNEKTDAETIIIDPITNEFFLISKRSDSAILYSAAYPFPKDTLELQKKMVLPFSRIVAGSISRDGTQILLKNYEKIFFWKRLPGESLPEALGKKPIELPYEREQQGEAIAWSDDGQAYYTLSEGTIGSSAELIVYKLKESK